MIEQIKFNITDTHFRLPPLDEGVILALVVQWS